MANKVILIGRTGAKPELAFTKDQLTVLNFNVATNESWKDKEHGEKREKTEWHRCFVMGKRAEVLAKHMEKGCKYYVEGKLEASSYDKDGQTHYVTRVLSRAQNNFTLYADKADEVKSQFKQAQPKTSTVELAAGINKHNPQFAAHSIEK